MLIPCAFAICWLQPVARIELPSSVPKNQYSSAMIAAENRTPVRIAFGIVRELMISAYLSTLTA